MTQSEKLLEYLRRLTPAARGNLLTELERLEQCGADIPGAASIIELLRAEFRADGQGQKHRSPPARYFFAPLEPLLVDGAPEHANTGAIQRGSLAPIWEWIGRDLLPAMSREYIKLATELITADRQREARSAASAFQTKVVKSLENTLASPDNVTQIRSRLAAYTASPTVCDDLVKMVGALRAREALAKFNEAMPAKIAKFEGAQLDKVKGLLDAFSKGNAEQLPFALSLVAARLKAPWQLIRLATKDAASKNAADVAATPYAIAVSMVLERLEDKRALLRFALKNERILVAREILVGIYDAEFALQVRIDQFAQSEWGRRLEALMKSTAELVDSEVSRFPENVGHILGSRSLRSHHSLAGRLTYWAWKGRDAVSDGLTLCKQLVSGPEKSRA
jgi:hypothetical protein